MMDLDQDSIKRLEKAITDLRQHIFFRMHDSLWRLTLFSLIRGLASGLGWVIGATILVYLLTVILSQIEFIPILGEWASRLIEQIEKFDK
ncbi:MAG TPA: hypothetical protein EYF74_02275 [Gammaproteobacteria bacterium]|jgi:hypothetical protein|nr:hypothetical protein [Gammaproteobacteria bacterium]